MPDIALAENHPSQFHVQPESDLATLILNRLLLVPMTAAELANDIGGVDCVDVADCLDDLQDAGVVEELRDRNDACVMSRGAPVWMVL